jgi:hypothetical protein
MTFSRETEYKYHINKKWKLKKSTSSKQKDEVISFLQSRSAINKPTEIHHQDPNLKNKLRRHLKTVSRKQQMITDHPQPGSSRDGGDQNSEPSFIRRMYVPSCLNHRCHANIFGFKTSRVELSIRSLALDRYISAGWSCIAS